MSEEQREDLLEQQKLEQTARYQRGKTVVIFIIIMEIVGLLVSIVESPLGSLISALLTGFLLIFLWLGKTWARVLLCVFMGIATVGHVANVIQSFFADSMWGMLAMQYGVPSTAIAVIMPIMYVIALVYSAYAFWMLGFSKSVKTFMQINSGR